jgi:hypothetical protein
MIAPPRRDAGAAVGGIPGPSSRYAFWTPARLLAAAKKIGSSTVALCETIMRTKPHPEQGFRSCLGILRMEKTYGAQRLEAACRRGISIGGRLRSEGVAAFNRKPWPQSSESASLGFFFDTAAACLRIFTWR